MIKLKIDYTQEEMELFFKFQIIIKNKLRYLYIGVSFLLALFSAYYLLIAQKLILGVVLLLASFIVLISFPRQIKKIVRKEVSSRYKRPSQFLTISPDEIIHEITEDNIITYSWEQIIQINEVQNFFYFYLSKTKALIINIEKFEFGTLEDLIKIIKDNNKKITKYQNFK